MKNGKTRMLCEAAVLIALAQILSYVRFYRFPNGGSVDCAMLPIVLFAVRYGAGWGGLVGFVFGLLQYFLGNGTAIDWTSIFADYLIAYTLLGVGAGLFRGRRFGVYGGALFGGFLRFLAHLAAGAIVWGKYMPDSYFGMTMTSPWFYSLLYNAPYMLLSTAAVLALFALLFRRMERFFTGADLRN